MRIFLYSLVTVFGVSLHAQEGQLPTNQDSLFLRAIYNEALSEGEAYENLADVNERHRTPIERFKQRSPSHGMGAPKSCEDTVQMMCASCP